MNPNISQQTFNALAAQGYNRIPVMVEVLADLDTPLSTYMKLAKGPQSYLLESVQGGEKWGRYSMIGLPCATSLRVNGRNVSIETAGQVQEEVSTDDPLAWIERYSQRYRVPVIEGMPRFTGGLVGYFGYDTVRYIEPKLASSPNPDPLANPDILLLLSEEVVVFDNLRGRLYIIVHADPALSGAYELAVNRLQSLVDQLRTQQLPYDSSALSQQGVSEADFVSGFTQEGYEQAVEACKDYIMAGDVMQVVLSQRLSIPFPVPSLNLYRALRSLNPSPYMYFFDYGDFQVAGSSPEILVRLEHGEVTVRPIAGTRPRGKNDGEDAALEQDLLSDPKELAEHLMLIDLGRNDIGRVCKPGTVKLTDKMVIERYSHVMHIVSNVVGQLEDGLSAMDVLRATFPAGTVSGAPKIRAMQIIDEFEPVKRGVYSGAVGYLGWCGSMDTAIAIRTAVIKNHVLYIQAGAGIVADSIPINEWEETMNKGRAIFKAVSLACAGFDASSKDARN